MDGLRSDRSWIWRREYCDGAWGGSRRHFGCWPGSGYLPLDSAVEASEVVRDGFRLLKEKDRMLEARLQALRGETQKGIDQAEAGELLDGPEAMQRIRKSLKDKKR